ncbi:MULTISPECIES: hypothetical protein [Pseudomonas]|uniref:hypothetical protein n=1 Tax=Pseudomonas TaxID=286 RepID=UPI000FC425E5|nr:MULTISPECIES: hypothetical protein [Pseudomonas]RUE17035.1 hypothetical protein IPC1222_25325 [Pseudomonas aeruginosa]CAH0136079.1 hypothetical protein SRABI111_00341 [Pseudomonas carnis]CAH0139037.1 hypothetical protein SRABI110_00485 [Pseudomonas carnis]CAH0158026.1 hypothetical protein SRABI64_00707 [Pseudomonas carnis]CAH0202155.1 hypothetical protein SRABI08_01919 [Pseudomonas carnis]
MYLVLHNIETGALLAKPITHKVNREEFSVSYAHDIFPAVEKVINIYIEHGFKHNLEDVEELLSEALKENKAETIKFIKRSFHTHGELVKIMLDETQFSSLSKFLISTKDKETASKMTKRSEMTIQEIYKESYAY